MNNDSLIQDYLDGTLDSESEDELFSLIGSDYEVRSEYKKYIAIESALKSDLSKIAPSVNSTINVFSKLGFTPPVSVMPPKPVKVSLLKRIAEFYMQHKRVMSASLASSLVTAFLLLYFLPGGSFIKSPQYMLGGSSYSGSGNTAEIPPSAPVNKHFAANMNRFIPSVQSEANVEEMSSETSHRSYTEAYNKSVNRLNAIPDEKQLTESQLFVRSNSDFALNYNRKNHLFDNSEPAGNKKKMGIQVSVSGNYGVPLSDPGLSQPRSTMLNTTGLNIAYTVAEDVAVEADVRREYFHQKYEERNLTSNLQHEQYPNYLTFGVGARFYFAKEGNFAAYGNVHAGANKSGYVGRAGVSVEYAPTPDYKFVVGVESSRLAYNRSNNMHYSDKIGVNYGVAFNF